MFSILENRFALQGKRLFCWSPVLLGIGISFYFSLKNEPSFYSLSTAILCCLTGISLRFIATEIHPYALTLRVFSAFMTLIPVGFLAGYVESHTRSPMPLLPYQAVWIEGVVSQIEHLPPYPLAKIQRDRRRVILKEMIIFDPWEVRSKPLRRTMRVTLKPHDTSQLEIGQRIKLKALLRLPSSPAYLGAFDLQRDAWFANKAGSARALSKIAIISSPSTMGVEYYLTRLREHISHHIHNVLSGQTAAFASTILSGETVSLSVQTRQDFAASGLAHLLAVAGLHLGLVMGFCVFTLRASLAAFPKLALYWPCRDIAYLVALIIGAVYVALTGFHLPGLRALGMACFVVLALLVGRQALSLRSLTFVAILLEMTQPSRVLDVSFQMSFAAVMALIVGYENLRDPLSRLKQKTWLWRKGGVPLIMLALTSLLAGAATLPISMAHFGAFQPWFVIANMVAVPLMGVWIMPLGLIALAVMPLGLEVFPLKMMGVGIDIVRSLASLMAHAPLASLAVPAMPSWGLMLVMAGLSLLCLWRGKERFIGLLCLLIGVSSPWLESTPHLLIAPDGSLVSFRANHHLYIGPKSKGYIPDSWMRAFALRSKALPSDCAGGVCKINLSGKTILLVLPRKITEPGFTKEGHFCDGLDLVVNLSRGRIFCPRIRYLGSADVRREGAWALYLSGKREVYLLSDREFRGNRPWVLTSSAPKDPGLPLAKSE
ncbi:DUF4131 domain-containing protein [Aristophania vespae]|uniref:DUF4131 domain-containing protein n=1 Tax=Aristophania vespae TaxID=2697033 RepID=A0A6P1NCI1_9PROT|nr:ComEC/Rec2 family competence protein [Aristophania vespae]QHI95159.1 DUF4131 domain-containing protein [Aristophania vespae]